MQTSQRDLFWCNVIIMLSLGLVGATGMAWEYMLSLYAAQTLGAMDSTILGTILLMVLSMGAGSATIPRFVKDPFHTFVKLEVLIAIAGALSVIVIAVCYGLAIALPRYVATTYNVPIAEFPDSGFLGWVIWILQSMPYIMAIVIGFLVGAEIPIMARIRETIYAGKEINNNVGTMYGVDYVGAAIGGGAYILWLKYMTVIDSVLIIASFNMLAGLIFMVRFKHCLKKMYWLIAYKLVALFVILFVLIHGAHIERWAESMLYPDKIVYQATSGKQKLVVTERKDFNKMDKTYMFFINGQMQVSTYDEVTYHSMTTTPAFMASKDHKRVLVVGGGDGFVVRDALRWNPSEVVLMDLDPKIIELFKTKPELAKANGGSLSDPRLTYIQGDAYVNLVKAINDGEQYGVIIVDLPDPMHPALSKLYSTVMYKRLEKVLAPGGSIVIQSTAPYDLQDAFISVKKTLEDATSLKVQQYHSNVPSFGLEWGWTIATRDIEPRTAIQQYEGDIPNDGYTTPGYVDAAFEWNKDFYKFEHLVQVNYTNTLTMYNYHTNAAQMFVAPWR